MRILYQRNRNLFILSRLHYDIVINMNPIKHIQKYLQERRLNIRREVNMNKHNKQIQSMDLSSAAETIESLDKRISDIEDKLKVVVHSLDIILRQFDAIEHKNTELCGILQHRSEDLFNDIEYLEGEEIY